MSEVQLLRNQLIDVIMGISDVRELKALYKNVEPKKVDKPKPNPNIPVMELKSGVTLEDIRLKQTVKKVSFEEHMNNVRGVEWNEPLTETLKQLD